MTRFFLLFLTLTLPLSSLADEGMWTLDNFPSKRFEARYGTPPTKEWLDHVRLSSVRLALGCSGSFVSKDGLVMTNHHCAAPCIQQLSTPTEDLMTKGFIARTRQEERKCPEMEVNRLEEIRDVTQQIQKATSGLTGAQFGKALRAEIARIERECVESLAGSSDPNKTAKWRCEVVTLYHGGKYDLYIYRRFQDVRLVFAPEESIAFFGGDPDNFMFPRYDLDVAFLRVYEDGKPAKIKHFFRWSREGPREGDVVFVTGHPGTTMRLYTLAQVEFLRDTLYPHYLVMLAELRGLLTEFSRQNAEHARIARNDLFFVENSFKAYTGMHKALLDRNFIAFKEQEERALKQKMEQDPALSQDLEAFDEIARALATFRTIVYQYGLLEGRFSRLSRLFQFARTLVRWESEKGLPDEKRLREFRESALPAVKQALFSEAPIYKDLEVLKMTFWLTKVREILGPDHPITRTVLGKQSPEELAEALVKGTDLYDPNIRKEMWEKGEVQQGDPMIEFARRIDQISRDLRARYEDEVESVEDKATERLAKARFTIYGRDTYPDATFTLRITYGTVSGYEEDGRYIEPITRLGGLFERATGRPPFALPDSFLQAKDKLDLGLPMNFASTCDIVGGNSGSPVINRKGEVVGLIFDGNIHSLGGAFWFDERLNRAVAVASPAIVEALRKVYGAEGLAAEVLEAR